MNSTAFEESRPHDYLQRLAASGLGRAYKSLAAAELGISPGDVLLDLGCGPGADLPGFAAAVTSDGHVIGVDNDPAAVREAISRTAALPQADVVEADIHALDLADGSVDRARTDRVLQHVADPAAAIGEARRVLRPGGTAVFAEPDWDTLIIDYPDLAVARAYTRFVSDRVVANSAIGRQLVRLATSAGFEITKVIPITTTFRDVQAADKVLGLQRVTERAVAAQYLAPQAGSQWLDHLAGQPFFASMTLFIVAATAAPGPKPPLDSQGPRMTDVTGRVRHKSLDQMTAEVVALCREKGWYDQPVSFGEAAALLHSEVSEIFEAWRRWGAADATGPGGKPEGIGSEFADVFIRLIDYCSRFGVSLEAEYERKMAYNRTRSYRHGDKRA